MTNRVLELDGTDSWVELPSNIFNDFTEATVEGWVKWDRFKLDARFFDFGQEGQLMAVRNGLDRVVAFEISRNHDNLEFDLFVHDILTTNQWFHIAAVSGPGGMKLLINGVLAGTATHAGSFAWIGSGQHNFLGRSNWRGSKVGHDEDFQGQMDEVRIWKVARTEEQVRDNMFRKLTGNEPGLAGLWDFDTVTNGVVKDLSPDGAWCHTAFGHDRKLHFPLLADFEPKGEVARLYGVYRSELLRHNRKRQPVHIDGEIVQPPKVNVG